MLGYVLEVLSDRKQTVLEGWECCDAVKREEGKLILE